MQYLTEGSGSIPSVPFQQPRNLFRYGEITTWSTQLLVGASVIANSSFRLFSVPLSSSGQGFANALTIAETSQKNQAAYLVVWHLTFMAYPHLLEKVLLQMMA